MLVIAVGVVLLVVFVIIYRLRVPGGVNPNSLGTVSEQWLAEHRASR